jgi:hypothetical protein
MASKRSKHPPSSLLLLLRLGYQLVLHLIMIVCLL